MTGFPPDYKEKPPSGDFPKDSKPRTFREFLRQHARYKLALILAIAIASIGVGWAVGNAILSNVINTNITVQAPQQIQISLASWPSGVTRGINASASININNPNPAISGRWILNFTRADGVQQSDFRIWWWIDQNNAIELNRQLINGKLVFTSPNFQIPQGQNTAYFTILAQREGSYSVAIALSG